MSAPKAWASHDPTHQFFPIRNLEDATHFSEVRLMLQGSVGVRAPRLTHPGITCNGCNKPEIEGVRHKCLECDGMKFKAAQITSSRGIADSADRLIDYDLCEACNASPEKRTQHNPNHVFFPITTPYDGHGYDVTRARSHPERLIHDGVFCNGCNSNPLVGIRHKCLDCEGM